MKLADTGLRKQPFRTHGKPLVHVPYAAQKNALRFLNDTRINRRGLGLLHGPRLSGKTTIVERFASSLPSALAVAVVDGAKLEPAALLKEILSQYGYDQGFDTASERFNMIRVVAMQQAASGHAPVLVVENVDEMSPVALEMICDLAEMTVDESSALRIVLVSNQSMLPVDDVPVVRSIELRLTGKFVVKPMTRTETATYAHTKLKSGGCDDPKSIMPPSVCDKLHSVSGGWPGIFDRLAMTALANAERIPLRVANIPDENGQKEKPPNVIEPPPQIILTHKHKTVAKISLDNHRYLIGRNELCDIDIVHEWISRQHAILIRNDNSTVIVDLKSRNGTYVNGKRVERCVLINDDIISLGEHRLKFVDPSVTKRLGLRGAGWDDTTLAESIAEFRKGFLRQLKSTS